MNKRTSIFGLALAIAVSSATLFAQSVDSPAGTKAQPEVREVAVNPAAYVGHLTVTGVVGIVTADKGFVLVDLKEYQEEGFGCLATDEPTKISVRWAGSAPKVREKVRVDGKLVKEKAGYTFTVAKVEKQ